MKNKLSHPEFLLKKALALLDDFEDIDEAILVLERLKNVLIDCKSSHKDIFLESFLLLIDAFRAKGNYFLALEEAKKAKTAFPKDIKINASLAMAHFEIGEYVKALTIIEQLLIKNNNDEIWWVKAHILQAMGEFALSEKMFLELVQKKSAGFYKPLKLSYEELFFLIKNTIDHLPETFANYINNFSINIVDIIDQKIVKNSCGSISPMDIIYTDKNQSEKNITFVKKNIETLCDKKNQIAKTIESALIHILITN